MDSKEEDSFMAVAIMFFIVFIVAAVTFSAYLLIDITKVSNLSNIHVTKNLKMAASGAQGNLYSDATKGIKDWIVYEDKQNGFEIKYPSDYKFEKSSDTGHLITLKKSNGSIQGSDSLSSAIYIDVKQAGDNSSLKDELANMGVTWNEKWTQEEIGGRPGIRTGEVRDLDGMEKEIIVWQFGGKIFSLQEYHFNEDAAKDSEIFRKMILEFKFI